jgi:hypothetical protein
MRKPWLLAAGLAAALNLTVAFTASAATLLHAYDLNNSYADALAGPDLTAGGANGSLGATGYTFGPTITDPSLIQGDWLQYTGGVGSSYSIELYFRLDTASFDEYSRIVNSSGGDNGLYIIGGASPLTMDYYEGGDFTGSPFTMSTMHHLVLTRTPTSTEVFLDGAQSQTLGATASSAAPGDIFLFKDDNNEQGGGFVDFVRFYDGALSSREVSYLYNEGQLRSTGSLTSSAPEPGMWALMMAGIGLTGAALRRRRVAFAHA